MRYICPEITGGLKSSIFDGLFYAQQSNAQGYDTTSGRYQQFAKTYDQQNKALSLYGNTAALKYLNTYNLDSSQRTIEQLATLLGMTISDNLGISSNVFSWMIKTHF